MLARERKDQMRATQHHARGEQPAVEKSSRTPTSDGTSGPVRPSAVESARFWNPAAAGRPPLVMPRALSDSSVEELIARLQQLTPDTSRRWGTMTAHEMVCHIADSFRGVMGDRVMSMATASPLKRRAMRVIALHLPLPWPKGISTRPEMDPKRNGTRPVAFEADRREAIALLRRFVSSDAHYVQHPMFGAMPRSDWLIWGHRHMDHHLRQFGL
jgi:hypothetical protein